MTNPIHKAAGILMATFVLAGSAFLDSAWAGDATIFTRHNFDLLMRWINFLILAVVIIKYGRKPLLQFLDNQKSDVTRSLHKLDEKKKEAESLVAKSQAELDDNQERLTQIKEKIIAEGQTRKEQLIAEAQNDARIMMDSAKAKIEGQIKTAFADIKAELVDMAADIALARLPTVITVDDQEKWAQHWFESVQGQASTTK